MPARSAALSSILLALTAAASLPAAEPEKPNVVLIVADDLGYADVSFHGGDVPTPAIDRIAHQGVRLEQFYVCPMCSPTRAGLMTGRWPLRMGIMRSVIPPWRKWGLPTAENTMAEMLAEAGYRRRGIIGKWHLGHSARKYHPLNQGFTYFYGHYNGAIDYFTHQREGEVDWHRNFDTLHEEGYSTDLIGAEAVRFIAEGPAGEPFFLYVPFNAPHSPFQAHASDVQRFAHLKPERRQVYAAMVVAMDRAIGKILDALDRRSLKDTLVWFFSDNGGVRGVADNRPLRGGKLTVYQGGIRVAAAARWPDGGLSGGKTVNGHIGYIDVYPTIKRIAGFADAADPNPLDGVDVLDVMRGKAEPPERDWYSYHAMSDTGEHTSVIHGPHKLNVHGPSVLASSPKQPRRLELFNLAEDPNEENNLAEDKPELIDDLLKRLRTFRTWNIEGIGPYNAGRQGFAAPKDWEIEPQ